MNGWSIGVPVVVALVTAFGAYLASVRKLSGKIGTSEASDLWEESADIRKDYRAQLLMEQQRTARLEQRVDKLEDVNNLLMLDNRDLRAQLNDCQRVLAQVNP